jgi:hypothetical protein
MEIECKGFAAMTCTKCDKPATGSFSIDIDVACMKYCDEHKEIVNKGLLCLSMGDFVLGKELLSKKKENC